MSYVEKYRAKMLAQTSKSLVTVLNETEVAKLLAHNSYKELEFEAEKLKYANSINDLIVKFIELRRDEDGNNLLVMERIYPLQYRALDMETRREYFDEFVEKLKELHAKGFVYRDLGWLTRLDSYQGNKNFNINNAAPYHNYMLTNAGIRLVDVGVSCLKDDVGAKIFDEFVKFELSEIQGVKNDIVNMGTFATTVVQ